MEELDELVPEIKAGRCIVFIGAGVPYYAGCKPWSDISNGLFNLLAPDEQCLLLEKYPDLKNENLREPEKIQILKDWLGDSRKEDYDGVISTVCTPTNPKSTDFITVVKSIKSIVSLSGVLFTTNIDNSLQPTEYFKRSEYPVRHKLPDHFNVTYLKPNNRIHLHGFIEDIDNVVLTQKDYDKRYSCKEFKDFINIAFNRFSIFFIGYGFRDIEIQDIFITNNTKDDKCRKHYCLSSDSKDFARRKTDFKEKYNINLINYGQRKELPLLLSKWVHKHFGAEDKKVKLQPPNDEAVQNISLKS